MALNCIPQASAGVSSFAITTHPIPITRAKTSLFNTPILPRRFFAVLSAKPISINLLRGSSHSQKYVYPDPDPQFAHSETEKFRTELLKKLSKDKETFGDDLYKVVEICSETFSDFLHSEYGGPGTLLVEPFTDMLVALKDRQLPGAPVAARAALLWAQNHVDQDWEIWNSKLPS